MKSDKEIVGTLLGFDDFVSILYPRWCINQKSALLPAFLAICYHRVIVTPCVCLTKTFLVEIKFCEGPISSQRLIHPEEDGYLLLSPLSLHFVLKTIFVQDILFYDLTVNIDRRVIKMTQSDALFLKTMQLCQP